MKKALLFISFVLFSNSIFSQTDKESSIPIPYETVEYRPNFPGGMNEFINYIMKNYQVSEEEEAETGVLEASVIIDKIGNITSIEIIKDVGNSGNEIKRILSKSPKWSPGSQNGFSVPVIYNFKVTFN